MSTIKKDKLKTYYLGQLEVKHGVEEADALIKQGKYEKVYDSDGDSCYEEVQNVRTAHV